MYGGENLIKDCLEYVVFEKHISDEYSRWRLHAKIVPKSLEPADPVIRTIRKPNFEDLDEDDNSSEEPSKGGQSTEISPDPPSLKDSQATPLLQTA